MAEFNNANYLLKYNNTTGAVDSVKIDNKIFNIDDYPRIVNIYDDANLLKIKEPNKILINKKKIDVIYTYISRTFGNSDVEKKYRGFMFEETSNSTNGFTTIDFIECIAERYCKIFNEEDGEKTNTYKIWSVMSPKERICIVKIAIDLIQDQKRFNSIFRRYCSKYINCNICKKYINFDKLVNENNIIEIPFLLRIIQDQKAVSVNRENSYGKYNLWVHYIGDLVYIDVKHDPKYNVYILRMGT